MTPDHRARQKAKPKKSVGVPPAPRTRSSDDAHDVVFFQRHPEDDPRRPAPGYAQLRSWPSSVRSQAMAVLAAVAAAPPKRFSGGGYWEAMHGEMTGWHEIRIDGPAGPTTDFSAFSITKPSGRRSRYSLSSTAARNPS